MNTGERFWQLIGMVFFILAAYGLMELVDVNAALQKQVQSQQQLLARQESLLKANHWKKDLNAVEGIQHAWMAYLPAEKTPTFAKARLLSDVRTVAKDAGVANLSVTATDSEGSDRAEVATKSSSQKGAQASYQSIGDKNKLDVLPSGVQMIKLTITGRFDPMAFSKLMLTLEDVQRFTIVERVTVRGAQLEIGIRCYWRVGTNVDQDQSKSVPMMGAL